MSASAPFPAIPFARRNAAHGALWLRRAFAMLSEHRVRWLLLLLAYYVIIVSIDFVPIVGAFVAPLLKPVFAVGFLAAAWSQERGEPPSFGQLFRGFRSDLRALLPLGAVFVAGMTGAVVATSFVDGGKLLEVLAGSARPDEAFAGRSDVQLAMLFGALCALPVVLALWFAPALVVFQDCGAGRALATSLRAAVANWRPIAVYGLLLFFYGGVLPGAVAAVIAAIAPREVASATLMLLLLPYLALLVATLHISDYVSYRDVFHPDEVPPSRDATGSAAPS
ncbi:MAG TPA: BPSS1780 family membrane protein [Casimicrobiaceae bacterium]|nr:BPSS1780 family membrane protein [Casimicrobiaceae bacterium]